MSLAVILFALSSNNSKGSTGVPTGPIKYVVNVTVEHGLDIPYTLIVIVTDEKGNLVTHPLPFDPKVRSYVFGEYGTKTGKRIAQLAIFPAVPGVILNATTDAKTGPFFGNTIYTFKLDLVSFETAGSGTGSTGVDGTVFP